MKRLVIIGGGFAGTLLARSLASEANVTLVDSKPFFEFTPGILRTLVRPSHMSKIQRPYTAFLEHVTFVQGKVTALTDKLIRVGKRTIPFDYCVIASGSRYQAPIKEQNILLASRAHHLQAFHERLTRAQRVVVAGGGIAGVELAAEIVTHYPGIAVSLVHSHDHLLPAHAGATTRYAEHFLRSRNVTFLFNERLERVKGTTVQLRSGKTLSADLVCFCTGIVPNTDFVPSSWKTKRGHIITNSFLQVPSHPHLFVAGDANSIAEEKTAQHAERQARVVLHNLRVLLHGKINLIPYQHQKESPVLISLGPYDGILEYRSFVLGGLLPAFLKWAVERREMWKVR